MKPDLNALRLQPLPASPLAEWAYVGDTIRVGMPGEPSTVMVVVGRRPRRDGLELDLEHLPREER